MYNAAGVGLLLGMINERKDVAACLQGDTASVSALSCLVYMASTAGLAGSAEVEATAIAAASARLRWPCLLRVVCEEVSVWKGRGGQGACAGLVSWERWKAWAAADRRL